MTGWSPAREAAPFAAVLARSTCPDIFCCISVSLTGRCIPARRCWYTSARSGKDPDVERDNNITIVVNPTKVDIDEVRETLTEAARSAGVGEPTLVETTPDDPGFGQTRAAVESGA